MDINFNGETIIDLEMDVEMNDAQMMSQHDHWCWDLIQVEQIGMIDTIIVDITVLHLLGLVHIHLIIGQTMKHIVIYGDDEVMMHEMIGDTQWQILQIDNDHVQSDIMCLAHESEIM